ncbi:UDP-N-acetyl-D-mannosaminuronic acid dehydrogenase [Pseudoxanthomonas sp. 3HH-4]|jgi:UDP-N-acetyl-D-mannosaminuronic acid dehydrogenase|uniref:UDP-N-acetyl-D-mannosamine dehydrogenase n=1 Tax=Pseudoxanthomonas sp. 3HH-4 TaxID=1690214 RepID=UPI00114ECC48|nr:UDP-N-acetyl-D-mannosamine dehydrogenase [Pseudoxanthomonas sp. 3HH-4]TQM17407.1 UDP-N-acetyl-D-mannosaminuronic acid dehydrogenase [Pseudoxanthomonas sp. 3HH-4]
MNHHDDSNFGTLAVVGLGYIGLPTAAMFASSGVRVHGVDISERAVDTINQGRAHIEEGDLDALVARCVDAGMLSAHLKPVPADAFIIAVPTPVSHDETHRPDVSYVMTAARSIAPHLKKGNLVILESTSPVGTTEQMAAVLKEMRPDLVFPGDGAKGPDVHLAYCPERIIPGRMLRELVENDRIIGGMTPTCARLAAALYKRFVQGECLLTNDRTAEMVKLTENAYRDVNIAFANELSVLCDRFGIDAWDVIGFANRHPRVSILNPGPGVGGHCIAVDPWFIVASAPEDARLIRQARVVNDHKPAHVISKVEQLLRTHPGAKVACLGLTYKPDVDDFRESPALDIAVRLTRRLPGRVLCSDPYEHALQHAGHGDLELTMVPAEHAVEQADVVLVLVGHERFRALQIAPEKIVLDTVGFLRSRGA